MRPMPTMPRRLPQMRWPSMAVGAQPSHSPVRTSRSPSVRRRAVARMRALLMSAVSSVCTPGVLVTVMPRSRAAATSILSTPVPKVAISFRSSPAWLRTPLSMRSVTVGTSTWADLTASISSAWVMARSSRLRRVSNSSIIRVSMTSGSLRVTTTSGLLVPTFIIPCPMESLFPSPRQEGARAAKACHSSVAPSCPARERGTGDA